VVITSNSCIFVGTDAELVEVEGTINLVPADPCKPGGRFDQLIAARGIDRLIKVARTMADPLDPDDLDSGRCARPWAIAMRPPPPTSCPTSGDAMLSFRHKILVDLFRGNGQLAAELLRTCAEIAVDHARVDLGSICRRWHRRSIAPMPWRFCTTAPTAR